MFQGHCLSTISPLTSGSSVGSNIGPPDLGDIPTFAIEPELYPKSSGGKVISTEGCFSCKVSFGRRNGQIEARVLQPTVILLRIIITYYILQINGDGRLRHRRTTNVSTEINTSDDDIWQRDSTHRLKVSHSNSRRHSQDT